MSYKKQFILAAILFFNSIAFGQNYITQLNKINQFLKTFDNGYYGYLEIKDGYLYDRFPSGKYSKSEIKYLGKAREEELKRKVVVDCLSEKIVFILPTRIPIMPKFLFPKVLILTPRH
ncbi:MAG: hypothetical protein IPN93_02495 [Bacteroidetes bacterium]|nr:hypothetical protein [Bacteroidota bacterium]